MARPSRKTDRLLLEAAKELIPQTGFTQLKIRTVAERAGVNLGMFNYHFKTKEHFIEILLSELYEEFFSSLKIETGTGDCLTRLHALLTGIARFIRDHRQLIVPLIEEIFLGNECIMTFARKNMTRHISIITRLIAECQEEGSIVRIPLQNVVPVIMGSVVGPTFMMSVLGRFTEKGLLDRTFTADMDALVFSDAAIEQRIAITLKGLSPEQDHE